MEKEKLPWRSFADQGEIVAGPIATKWNLLATPTMYVIDQKGVIQHKWVGGVGERVIDGAIEKLIVKAAERK